MCYFRSSDRCRKSPQKTKRSLKENLVDLKTSYTICNVLAQHMGDTTKGLVTVLSNKFISSEETWR